MGEIVRAGRASVAKRAVPVLVSSLLLVGCGGESRDHIAETYEHRETRRNTEVYHSPDPVQATVDAIVRRQEPTAQTVDRGRWELRFPGDVVIVEAAAEGGSTVIVRDLDRRPRRGLLQRLGALFGSDASGAGHRPGSERGAR
ncbi:MULTISPECIES: DUF4247 domain-containing protein [Rhodococcus]|uniref:DUF4247 domain-containing protein n=1 Tax=Rhodococcus TaxID=1827 RepID=UPI000660D419|nr:MULTISPECIES: DUF4247 domain-containing protein [Rhodococcus]AWH01027.1 DUF4247 domain-containing protein [Rhodococcus ruber]MCZ1071902.1 DUF4247 domain-containing protein [Rhodococcus sp. A5(2022)]MDO1480943.1 DUF4247 domain-containing protein [Rhodococcus ruber]RQM35436.1 hypothetical protein TN91_04165 [Rhodococcus ruber]UIR35486.1 DUF4247 domain-containing protein [Rhodococcus sp. DMF-1]